MNPRFSSLGDPELFSRDAAIVTVLYHPSDEDVANLVLLAGWGCSVFAVVNALAPGQADLPGADGLTFIRNDRNVGLARALNQGLAAAMATKARYALMLDQDSRPSRDMLDGLIAAASAIEYAGRALACVAPVLRDRKQDAEGTVVGTAAGAVTATFATSGTMLTRRAWDEVGPMWEDLFIDGIDHEWCFRARSRGLETVVVPGVVMDHDMGDLAVNVLGRFRPVHRSPMRHYYITRNTMWLARRDYIPFRWRAVELAKMMYRVPIYVLVSSNRTASLLNIANAVIDGVTRSKRHEPV